MHLGHAASYRASLVSPEQGAAGAESFQAPACCSAQRCMALPATAEYAVEGFQRFDYKEAAKGICEVSRTGLHENIFLKDIQLTKITYKRSHKIIGWN